MHVIWEHWYYQTPSGNYQIYEKQDNLEIDCLKIELVSSGGLTGGTILSSFVSNVAGDIIKTIDFLKNKLKICKRP